MPAHSPLSAGTYRQHSLLFILAALIALSGCAAHPTLMPSQIALLAPFEGTYRHVGYDALYAARLALRESDAVDIELLPVDDGGTLTSARDRAAALANNPMVSAAIVLGPNAAHPDVLLQFGDLPVITAGNWVERPNTSYSIVLSGQIQDSRDTEFFTPLNEGSVIRSSGRWPDPDFVRRYQDGQMFAPEPTPVATLVYDAVRLIVQALQAGRENADLLTAIENTTYIGYNGPIRFQDRNWLSAPIYDYTVQEGKIYPTQ